jgi:hypothetical protein
MKCMSWEVYSETEERVLGTLFIKWKCTGIFIQKLKNLSWEVYL